VIREFARNLTDYTKWSSEESQSAHESLVAAPAAGSPEPQEELQRETCHDYNLHVKQSLVRIVLVLLNRGEDREREAREDQEKSAMHKIKRTEHG
jgi:hypothetical protein